MKNAKNGKSRQTTLSPVHPGEILREDLMKPLGLSQNRLALDLRVPVTRISEIVRGRRGITAETALRLSRYFGTTPEFWLNLQNRYELRVALSRHQTSIERDVHPRARPRRSQRSLLQMRRPFKRPKQNQAP